MYKFPKSFFRYFLCKADCYFLSFFWLLGLVFGIIISSSAGDSVTSMMLTASESRMSIVSLLFVVLPFLFAALAAYFSKHWLLPAICFCRAFLFGFSAHTLSLCYGASAWIVQFFLMFTDFFVLPLYFWFCLKHICCRGVLFKRDLFACIAISVLVWIIDFCFISPYLAMLINY